MATPILWGLMATSAIAELDLGAGGLSIGGPGKFTGKAGEPFEVHSSETPRTLCLSLDGTLGTTRALFNMGPDFAVTKGETASACKDGVSSIEVMCEGGNCKTDWRVDTVGAQGPEGDTGDTGLQGMKGDTGPLGPQGGQGNTGPQGPAGEATVQIVNVPVPGAQGPTGDKGDKGVVRFYIINDDLVIPVGKRSKSLTVFCYERADTVTGVVRFTGSSTSLEATSWEDAGPDRIVFKATRNTPIFQTETVKVAIRCADVTP